jgi:hypothetical protein
MVALIVAVHQPQFLPWLGYFHKMMLADVFCYLDNVQFKKNEWQNRNRIKTACGWQWLTVPVRHRHRQKIREVQINDRVDWSRKHLRAFETNYARAPWYDVYMPMLAAVYERNWHELAPLNLYLIGRLREALQLDRKPCFSASSLQLGEDPTGRLIEICQQLGADTYLAGAHGAGYMDLTRFEQNNIRVVFQKFVHPEYPQLFGAFQSHLSILDLLFNCGPASADIIQGAGPGRTLQP